MTYNSEVKIKTAERLKQLREDSGFSHDRLASALHKKYGNDEEKPIISSGVLKNYEVIDKYHTKFDAGFGMNITYLVMFADFYGVSTDYLLGLTGVKTPDVKIQAATKMLGLSEEAIANIKSINETVTDVEGVFKEAPIPKDISYTLALGIILNEILVSKELESLLFDIKELACKQSVVEEIRKKVDNDKAKVVILSTKDNRIAEEEYRFNLWSTSIRAQEIIANVADRYYTKTKDGVRKTYTIDSVNKSKDGE